MDELDEIEDFLKVYKGLKPMERKLLKNIVKLQETAFYAPPHWSTEPTKKMLDDHDNDRRRSIKDFDSLKKATKLLKNSLRSPFL